MALQIIRNNIINVKADAIVNTANPAVGVGRGVDQAIYEAAGWERLLEARREIGEMSPGEAAWTPAFDLKADYIIHTVGPAWRGGGYGERETVAKCYSRSLELAAELGCESIAFPLIATGTYGFPKDEALQIAISEISRFLLSNDMEVLLVVYDKESFEVSGKLFSDIRTFISDREVSYYAPQHASRRPGNLLRRFREARYRTIGTKRAAEEQSIEESRTEEAAGEYAADTDLDADFSGWYESDSTADEERSYTLYGGDLDRVPALQEEMEKPASPSLPKSAAPSYAPSFPAERESLSERLRHMDKTFQEYLFMLIDRRGLTDTEVYKKANIDRKHFSKIRSNVDYKPSKKTALALAVALELNIDETRDLLARAGLALSPSMISDKIIEYCIETGNYDIYEINCILFKYDQQTLGV